MNKKGETMKEKRISFGQGNGSLTHNNREFMADNVDPLRTPQNITFVRQPIGEAYDQLFAESTERYNAKQKRNDRKAHGSYYEHLFGVKPCNTVRTAADKRKSFYEDVVQIGKRKSFYEDVVQIGKREDSGYGTEDFQLVADCLKEYMEGFRNRNPNFYVFNAVLHMDEATPHLHIDYIPVGHYKRGQDVQNGIAQALKEMGYGEGKQAIARWRAAEVEVLNKICLEHGIKPLAPEKAKGTLEIPEYKEKRRQADELAVQNTQARYQLELKKTMLVSTETQLAEQKKILGDTQQQVREATADLIEQEQKLEDGETELSEVKEKVSKAKQEYERQQQKSQSIMCFLPDLEKDRKLEMEFDNYHNELRDMLKSPVSIMKHKDGIKSVVDKMEDLVIKAQDKSHKADLTIYDLRANQENFDQLYDAEQAKSKALYSQVQTLTSEKSALAKKYNATMAVYRQIERIAPDVIEQAKRLVEAEKQREQAQQIEYQPTRKKKSWGLE